MATKNNKYGSIPVTFNGDKDEENLDTQYTQYITPTAEDKRKECMSALVPVLLCVLLMGGIAFALSRDFNHLYPSRHGDSNKRSPTKDDNNQLPSKDFSHAECSIHNTCVEKNLTGMCCPTSEGIHLNCCFD